MTISLITDSRYKDAWNKQAKHPLQTWEWGTFRQHMNVKILRVGVSTNDNLRQVFLISLHPIPGLNYYVAYVPKSDIPSQEVLDFLNNYGLQHNIIAIQWEPNVQATSELSLPHQWIPAARALFTPHTFVLNLTESEETLLKKMHHKTRYNLNLAKKRGVIIEQDASPEAFTKYLALSNETTKRQGFYAHSNQYHQTQWRILHDAGMARLWTATYEQEIVATWIIFAWKNTLYYPYGATSRHKREVMAPYLLLWEIARWGKANGFEKFDLWGAMGSNPDVTDPWYGFHRFKAGFSPDHITFIGSFDQIIFPRLYRLYTTANMLRWQYLQFKRRFV